MSVDLWEPNLADELHIFQNVLLHLSGNADIVDEGDMNLKNQRPASGSLDHLIQYRRMPYVVVHQTHGTRVRTHRDTELGSQHQHRQNLVEAA